MIVMYVCFFIISGLIFYFTGNLITNLVVRLIISGLFFATISIVATVFISKGHAPPEGSKVVDIEEMKKMRKELDEKNK